MVDKLGGNRMDFEKICRRIKGKRTEVGITQEEMANKLDIAPNTYNRKEQGIREFTIKEIIQLCDILQCKITDIFLE